MEHDGLNQAATEIALNLINGTCSTAYKIGMSHIFRTVPSLIDDVDPKYQDQLKSVIK